MQRAMANHLQAGTRVNSSSASFTFKFSFDYGYVSSIKGRVLVGGWIDSKRDIKEWGIQDVGSSFFIMFKSGVKIN
ncbi:hypothetical protein M5K25_014189 [Dendrobium thyrsiflorum]|uniref:Uncharacterized protein n=1 Tax=Dendrobium thyrsiflorum TaxID=117978 RepID=A0ABD0V254_DENTH